MNGLLKKIALVLIVGFGIVATTQAAGGYSVTVSEGNVVIIKFDNIQSEIAYVRLIDEDGVQLWSDIVKGSTNFIKRFNLAQLPDGNYDIIMKDGDIEHTQGIRKSINKVYVVSTSIISFLEPIATLEDKNLKITFPAGFTKLKSVSFQGAQGGAFFLDDVDYDNDFAKAYNLGKLPEGSYSVILKTDSKTFYKEVILK